MRTTAILILITIFRATAAQMLPGDGAAVTVYGIDAEIAITQHCSALVYL